MAFTYLALGDPSPPNFPEINLSSGPLYEPDGDKPAMVIAMSGELNSLNSPFQDYDSLTEYFGYFNPNACYTYNDQPTNIPNGANEEDYYRFEYHGPTNGTGNLSHGCDDAFSGNFLNYATMTNLDLTRMALTGGDRYIDTTSLTLLQRAHLPENNTTNGCILDKFKAKFVQPTSSIGGSSLGLHHTYRNAIPIALQMMASSRGYNNFLLVAKGTQALFRTDGIGYESVDCTTGYSHDNNQWMGTPTYYTANSTEETNSIWTPISSNTADTNLAIPGIDNGAKDVLFVNKNQSLRVSVPMRGNFGCQAGALFPQQLNTLATATNTSELGPWKCYTRANGTQQTPLNTNKYLARNAFQIRVKVCDSNANGTLIDVRNFGTRNGVAYGLCNPYSDGNGHTIYKPTGALQAYADQVRVAAFGYLADTDTGTYGGVLRAPMKFIGNRTFNESGVDTTTTNGNPQREWDPTTGVLIANPQGNLTFPLRGSSAPVAASSSAAASAPASAASDATEPGYASGVINYINQFGRTTSVLGTYKTRGAVGELYYEALRYLQGLGPSTAAIENSKTQSDGFPVYTSWSDPYGGTRTRAGNYACRKANIVVAGSVQSYDSNTLLRRTASTADNLPNLAAWNGVVAAFEAKLSSTYVDGAGVSQTTQNNPSNAANTNAQTGVNGLQGPLVGAAYWAHTHDIRGTNWTNQEALQRPGLRVTSFFLDNNTDFQSFDPAHNADLDHDGGDGQISFRRQKNQFFTAAKYGGFAADPKTAAALYVSGSNDPTSYNSHGNPFYRDNMTTADNKVWTDTRAGRGNEARTYFVLNDGRAVLAGVNAVFEDIIKARGNIAGASTQTNQLTAQNGNTIYQARFDRNDWSGDIWAIPINVDSSGNVTLPDTGNSGSGITWSASAKLAARSGRASSRNIVMGRGNSAAESFNTSMSESAKALLDIATTTIGAGRADDRINYLRGDSTNENAGFRPRNGKYLGDIVNSGVVYAGAPTTAISDDGYAAFYAAQKDRPHMVYAGSNDGMLHAFVATQGGTATSPGTQLTPGDEMFAFIPSWVTPSLAKLTDPVYNRHHRPFVDATPVVAEAQVGTDWKTVLVGGLGGGGRSVYALDVTDPTAFGPSKVLWEFSNANDVDDDHSFELGNVVGTPQILKFRTADATYKWFAVVASGVNNYVKDSTGKHSLTGQPALFLLDLSHTGSSWSKGRDYYKISLPLNSTVGTTLAPGLVNFSATLGMHGEVTTIYAGDLHGQVWKLDFTLVESPSDWTINKLSFFRANDSSSAAPVPMFIAKAQDETAQPISAAPALTRGPAADSVYVTIGTGRYLDAGDQTLATTQTLYVLFDDGSRGPDSPPSSTPNTTAAISSRRRLAQASLTDGTITTTGFTPGRPTTDDDPFTRAGWYLDFKGIGERQVSNPQVAGTKVLFATVIPESSTNSGVCDGGSGNLYWVDYAGGIGNMTRSTVGVPGAPLSLMLSTSYSQSDSTGRKIKTIVSTTVANGSSGVASVGSVTHTMFAGRLSWRRISN